MATGGAEQRCGGQRVWWQQLWSFQRDREKPKAPVRPAKPRDALDLCCSLESYTTLARRLQLRARLQHCATESVRASTGLDVCLLRAALLASLRSNTARAAPKTRGCLLQCARRRYQTGALDGIMGRLGPGRRLLEVLWPLRNYGIGARVTKPTWTGPDCFWEITKLKYNKRAVRDDGSIRLGKAWGTLHWRGTPVGRPDRRVPGHSKAMWQLFGDAPPPATDADRPHLTKRLHKKYYVVVDD